jgi:hypothetical protein
MSLLPDKTIEELVKLEGMIEKLGLTEEQLTDMYYITNYVMCRNKENEKKLKKMCERAYYDGMCEVDDEALEHPDCPKFEDWWEDYL